MQCQPPEVLVYQGLYMIEAQGETYRLGSHLGQVGGWCETGWGLIRDKVGGSSGTALNQKNGLNEKYLHGHGDQC